MSDLIEQIRALVDMTPGDYRTLAHSSVARVSLQARLTEAADELSRLQSLSDQNRLTGGWAYKLEPLLVDLIREQSEGEWDDATIRADAAKFNAAIIDMIRPSPPLPLPGGEEKR